MKAIDLVKAVCQYNQEQIEHWSKECSTEPNDLFSKLFEDMVGDSYIEVTPVLIRAVKQDCSSSEIELLQKEVKAGCWVYSFFCSADFYDFQWCASLDHALQYYTSLANQPFCGTRMIFFATDEEILKVEVK